jgi:hypothetical protein
MERQSMRSSQSGFKPSASSKNIKPAELQKTERPKVTGDRYVKDTYPGGSIVTPKGTSLKASGGVQASKPDLGRKN